MFTYYKTCDFRKTGLHRPRRLHCHHPCRRSRLLFQG